MLTKSELDTLRKACAAVEADYDAGRCLMDQDMVVNAQRLVEQTETIRKLITAYEAERERRDEAWKRDWEQS